MKRIDEIDLPEELRYSADHEWVRPEGDLARVGLTDYAQDQFGDIVYAELPSVGAHITQGAVSQRLTAEAYLARLKGGA